MLTCGTAAHLARDLASASGQACSGVGIALIIDLDHRGRRVQDAQSLTGPETFRAQNEAAAGSLQRWQCCTGEAALGPTAPTKPSEPRVGGFDVLPAQRQLLSRPVQPRAFVHCTARRRRGPSWTGVHGDVARGRPHDESRAHAGRTARSCDAARALAERSADAMSDQPGSDARPGRQGMPDLPLRPRGPRRRGSRPRPMSTLPAAGQDRRGSVRRRLAVDTHLAGRGRAVVRRVEEARPRQVRARSRSAERARQAPGPPGPLTTLPAVSPPSMTITEPVK